MVQVYPLAFIPAKSSLSTLNWIRTGLHTTYCNMPLAYADTRREILERKDRKKAAPAAAADVEMTDVCFLVNSKKTVVNPDILQ